MHLADSLARLRGLLNPGSLVVAIWIVASLFVGRVLGWLARGLLARIARHTVNGWDDQLVARLRGPITAACTIAIAFLGLTVLELPAEGDATLRSLLRGIVVATVFWAFSRLVDVAEFLLAASEWARRRAASRSFIGLASRIAKVAVFVLGILSILSQAGYHVGTLIAGLGIGGLALALGAQKTLENVFAAFAIAADEPFHLGDTVLVDNVIGTVESIGLRSTRIRTPDRTVVVIPNGKLAEMKTESLAARDRIRLSCTLGLVYQTSSDQLRRIMQELEAALRAQPKVWPDDVSVVLKGLGDSSMDVEVNVWFQTSDFGEFKRIRQDMLFRFIEIVEAAGTSFAYPTRTVHVAPTK